MTQHVPVSQKRPRASGRAKPELTFRWEHFATLARELRPLFDRHWREIALDQDIVPLDPDWDSYFDLALRGVLHILTARTADGKLVGYIFNLIGGHQHYVSTRFCHTEMFWLDPHWRRGWLGVKMILENIAGLREREVVISTINVKLHFKDARVARLLVRLGYSVTDLVLRKRL